MYEKKRIALKHQFTSPIVIVIFRMCNFNGLNILTSRKKRITYWNLNGKRIRRHAPRPIFQLNVWSAREKHVARMRDTMRRLRTKNKDVIKNLRMFIKNKCSKGSNDFQKPYQEFHTFSIHCSNVMMRFTFSTLSLITIKNSFINVEINLYIYIYIFLSDENFFSKCCYDY